ncbi:MAG: hypothetical protein QHH30_10770 [candidate division NC10 bacterium]|nr:hypothetical protein [candidate division NC10 bacterium]
MRCAESVAIEMRTYVSTMALKTRGRMAQPDSKEFIGLDQVTA